MKALHRMLQIEVCIITYEIVNKILHVSDICIINNSCTTCI